MSIRTMNEVWENAPYALDGLHPECWNCGTYVHDGPCVSEEITA